MARAVDDKSVAVWRGRLERFARSGDSVVRFCAAEGVSTASFYRWRKELAGRQYGQMSTTAGVPIPGASAAGAAASPAVAAPAFAQVSVVGTSLRIPARKGTSFPAGR